MRSSEQGYRVAVVGASSLLGKELLTQFEERRFPVARLLTFEDEQEEPELPILDFESRGRKPVGSESLHLVDLDFVFLAVRLGRLPPFLAGLDGKAENLPGSECAVIDLSGRFPASDDAVLRIPMLEAMAPPGAAAQRRAPRVWISPHGATIATSLLLSRLASRFEIEGATAHVFSPASESGARGIDELQKQTVHLLSFRRIPEEIFGAQMAFNLLPRLDGAGKAASFEERLNKELAACLSPRSLRLSLRVIHAPVFYALGISLYIEMRKAVAPAAAEAALRGKPVALRKASEAAPSPVQAAGKGEILVDAVRPDPAHPQGLWVWLAADPLRLAAVNAIECAESLARLQRS